MRSTRGLVAVAVGLALVLVAALSTSALEATHPAALAPNDAAHAGGWSLTAISGEPMRTDWHAGARPGLDSASSPSRTPGSPPMGSPRPSGITPVAVPPTVDLGQSVTFTEDASGGIPPYTYEWSDLPLGCASQNSSRISCSPTENGSFYVTVLVLNVYGMEVLDAGVQFAVYTDPTLVSLVASPAGFDLGQTGTLNATFSGGSGGFYYSWSRLPSGCSGSDSSLISCKPTAVCNCSLGVTESDSNGMTAAGQLRLVVSPAFTAVAASSGYATDVGHLVTLVVDPRGGSGTYSYEWAGIPGCVSIDAPTWFCVPEQTGSSSPTCNLTDSNAGSAQVRLSLQVSSHPTVTILFTPNSASTSDTINIESVVANGTAPFSFIYSDLPSSSCTGENTSMVNCGGPSVGSWKIGVEVQDGAGGAAFDNSTLNVSASATAFGSLFGGHAPLLVLVVVIVIVTVVALALIRSRGRPPWSPAEQDLPSGRPESGVSPREPN